MKKIGDEGLPVGAGPAGRPPEGVAFLRRPTHSNGDGCCREFWSIFFTSLWKRFFMPLDRCGCGAWSVPCCCCCYCSVTKKKNVSRAPSRAGEGGSEVSAWGMIKSIFRARDVFSSPVTGKKSTTIINTGRRCRESERVGGVGDGGPCGRC